MPPLDVGSRLKHTSELGWQKLSCSAAGSFDEALNVVTALQKLLDVFLNDACVKLIVGPGTANKECSSALECLSDNRHVQVVSGSDMRQSQSHAEEDVRDDEVVDVGLVTRQDDHGILLFRTVLCNASQLEELGLLDMDALVIHAHENVVDEESKESNERVIKMSKSMCQQTNNVIQGLSKECHHRHPLMPSIIAIPDKLHAVHVTDELVDVRLCHCS